MESTSDLGKAAFAREWLRMASGKWRLQTLQHRGRYNRDTGKYERLPTRLRRFLNGTPVGVVCDVIEILGESGPYSGTVFNMEDAGDLTYRATSTAIRKDGNELTGNTKDATYTIIQDLVLVTDGRDELFSPDGSSCSQVTSTTYRWDEQDVETCPESSQGVTYQIANVNRDRDTDLLSYQVRKTVAITHETGPVVAKCSDRRVVTVQTWDNLYGSPGAFRYDSEVHSGGTAPVPAACTDEQGRTVELSVQQNPDCTYRVTAETTIATEDGGLVAFFRDQYKISESVRTVNATVPFANGVEYAGGVTVRRSSEKNDDGTYTNSVETETERPVPSSTFETRVTPRATVVTRTDTNQESPASGIPGGKFGSFKYTKTPGGLFTNEYVEYARNQAARIGASCTDTAFLHTHESADTASSVSQNHVASANNGIVRSVTYDTDDLGVVTRREQTRTEHTVRESSVERTATALGVSVRVQHRSVSESYARNLLNFSGIGKSVRITMTDGKMRDVETTEFEVKSGAVLGLDCSKTVYQHVHETASAAASVGTEAAEAGGGVVRGVSYSVDPSTGSVTRKDRTTTELAVLGSRVVTRVTARGKFTTVTDTNVASASHAAESPGDEQTVEITQGGRVTETYTSREATPGDVEQGCEKTYFRETDTSAVTSETAYGRHPERTDGTTVTRRQSLGDDGLWKVEDTVMTEEHRPGSGLSVSVGRLGTRTTVTNTQVKTPSSAPTKIGGALAWERTQGGNYTEQVTTMTPKLGNIGTGCEQDIFKHTHTTETASASAPTGDVQEASDGKTRRRTGSLTDAGVWDVTEVVTTEKEVDLANAREYKDALGKTTVHTVTNSRNPDVDNGVDLNPGKDGQDTGRFLQHIERQKTPGNRTTVSVTKEEAKKWCSKLIKLNTRCGNDHTEFFWQGYVFRNHTEDEVDQLIRDVENITVYSHWGDSGSYRMSPSINVTPNKFGLLDGSVSITFHFTPQGYAVGRGKKPDDAPYEVQYNTVGVSVTPMGMPGGGSGGKASGKGLAVIRTETHVMGAGTGFTKFSSSMTRHAHIQGSQFQYNPAGDSFTYDLITKLTIEHRIVDLSATYTEGQ